MSFESWEASLTNHFPNNQKNPETVQQLQSRRTRELPEEETA